MELVFSKTIDLTNIVLDLLLIITTTGATYFLFSYLPVRRRKEMLSRNLRGFKDRIELHIIEQVKLLERRYWTRSEQKIDEESGEMDTIYYVEFPDFPAFLKLYKKFKTIKEDFNESFYGSSIIALIASLMLDDKMHMALYTQLTKLEKAIDHFHFMDEQLKHDVYQAQKETDLLPDEEEREYLTLCIQALEDLKEIAETMTFTIDLYLGNRSIIN